MDIDAVRFPEPLAPKLFARFSWAAFCVANGRFADWVDRGRDHPSHRVWADYLAWVFNQAGQGIVEGDVLDVTPMTGGGWQLRYADGGSVDTAYADAVVLTGTGRAKSVPHDAASIPDDRLLDAETFWDAREAVLGHREIAIAGAGGAAGTIIAWLSNRLAERDDVTIISISPLGTLFPRGDGYVERRWFSDPTDWRELSLPDRQRLLERTEGGVISLRNKSIIDRAQNIAYVPGYADHVAWDDDELTVEVCYDRRPASTLRVDCLVNAIGFDPWTLLELVKVRGVTSILRPGESELRRKIAEAMLPNLSFGTGAQLGTGLHVPTLASLAHGPGFGTFGCLGLAASAMLDDYLE